MVDLDMSLLESFLPVEHQACFHSWQEFFQMDDSSISCYYKIIDSSNFISAHSVSIPYNDYSKRLISFKRDKKLKSLLDGKNI